MPDALPDGVVYAPYISLQVTPTLLGPAPSAIERLAAITDPELKKRIDEYDERARAFAETFSVSRRIRERYGRKVQLAESKFFAKVEVTDLR